jgi:hypothetical protein
MKATLNGSGLKETSSRMKRTRLTALAQMQLVRIEQRIAN